MPVPASTPTILLIGGSDSGGGAGLQADLRVLSAYRMAGACAVTAATAQNTHRVWGIHALPPVQVARQLEAILADIDVSAIKIGMLANPGIIRVVASTLKFCRQPIVLDPVLNATVGGALTSITALAQLKKLLIPLCAVFTPNLPEAEALIGRRVKTISERISAVRQLQAMGGKAVVLKGGHGSGQQLIDIAVDTDGNIHRITAKRLALRTHGTGCTYATAIAAELAQGIATMQAIRNAHSFLQSTLRSPIRLGKPSVSCPGFR